MDLSILKSTDLFKDVSEKEIESALKCLNAKVIKKKKDEFILRSGDTTENMGILLSGRAIILQEDIWGNRNIISKVNPLDSFAEAYASSNGVPLNIDVIAELDSEILLISINKIMDSCASNCAFHTIITKNMINVLARKMLVINNKITTISKRSTKEKVLAYLSLEAKKKNSLIFDIPFDRQELADYLCVERAAMSVVLSTLQKEGIIRYNKNHFELLNDKE